ncbi:MAG: hypothetical protein J1E62_06700 [Lachnospiraceae bacterium]|nr:hypothetical protein [Lachnospiraceae bacterium]
MSNIIKSVYFNVDVEQRHLIDSESRMEQLIPEIYAAEESSEKPFTFRPLQLGQELDGDLEEGFQDGLSVIHMDDVREEERQKLSEEISQEMEEEVQGILEQAKQDAEEIIEQARSEADDIRNQAEKEGRDVGIQAGLAEADERAQEREKQFQQTMQLKLKELEEQRRQMEPFFAGLVAELVEKITGVVCKEKKGVILHLIEGAVQNLEKPKQVTLRVSKEDMALVSLHKADLKKAAGDVLEFDVMEDSSLEANQCIIETENKIIDCSLDVQLKNLQEQLRMLAM